MHRSFTMSTKKFVRKVVYNLPDGRNPYVDVNRSDEDPVDPKPEIEENCKPKCVKQLLIYQACVKRVEKDESGTKHCTGQSFDYWGCVDKCAADKIFAKLK